MLRANSAALQTRLPDLAVDQPQARILRSVVMRPEHEQYVDHLLPQLEQWARKAASVVSS